jgi:hypothetical protein
MTNNSASKKCEIISVNIRLYLPIFKLIFLPFKGYSNG